MRRGDQGSQGGDGARGTELPARALLAMLEVRSSDALPAWLAAELARNCRDARQRVMRVFPGGAARSRSLPRYALFSIDDPVLAEAPRLLSVDALLVETIRDGRPWSIVHNEGGARFIATLASAGEVRYVIELAGDYDPGDARRLGALATIASRYFDRLCDAETDPLTRLANRRAFHAQVDSGLRRWTASGRPWYFAMLDLDHFKRINDGYGHLYGDEILVVFANLLRATFRAGDLPFRFGGEEFVLMFGVEEPQHALQTLERFRAAVEAHDFPGVGRVTVSIGYTRIPDAGTPSTTLIDRADQALYYAKEHGRNRTCEWEALVAAGELAPAPSRKDVTLF